MKQTDVTISVISAMEPIAATIILLDKGVLDPSEISCLGDKFAIPTVEKEPTTCSNLFSGGHIDFGSEQVEYQARV